MEDTEKLWAEYGKLSAQREQLQAALSVVTNQMRETYNKIQQEEKKEKCPSKQHGQHLA